MCRLTLLLTILGAGCITRPGMNPNCEWPPETPRRLVLSSPADARHLVIDAELVAELVDRYRFSGESQEACEARLIDVVARTHGVSAADFLQARERIPDKGLDLAVNVPMAALFLIAAWLVVRAVQRRFAGDKVPIVITLVLASVVLSWLFVMLGEFWTSILQMIRVGSQHVGGRIQRLPWLQHQRQIFAIGVTVFWAVVLVRSLSRAEANSARENELS
jgi:hypothetical protein